MLKFFKYLFFLLVAVVVVAAASGAGWLYYMVVVAPAPEMEESVISDILARESPVFYRDGQHQLGVLFEGTHRQYVHYKDIPKDFIHALLAAEDEDFFRHYGVDPPGIVRALIANIRAGRIVQGGSTITQQTAKNLFKRESRSYRAKLKELLYAFRLEYRYSKEKILEFYCNQFFVSGNGHGLGVAARYFFDKKPEELTLHECVFIAGSVKRPNYYNPFLSRNQDDPAEIRRRGKERMGYVLGHMLTAGTIDRATFDQLSAAELTFRRGRMSFTQNTAMDLVREGLENPFITDALEENGISNISTSGARVITTLDFALQNRTVETMRRHLSGLDTQLRGYRRDEVQAEYQTLEYRGDRDYVPGNFVFGVVERIDKTERGTVARVSFNEGRVQGELDSAGMQELAEGYAKRHGGSGAAARAAVFKQLQPGDTVYVAIRAVGEDGVLALDLVKYPEVEGAAIVLQEGAIRAMTGGAANEHYNRATAAKRLMGSTFKTFVYAAALQLGWSPLDLLSNTRQDFPFLRQSYSPQPDHFSPFSRVTMSWAGVTSENVATVWLLYHLTDHLNPAMIRELATKLDMAPRVRDGKAETYQAYRARMRDRYGIVVSRANLGEAVFSTAVRSLRPDFVFENRLDEYRRLEQLGYGEFQELRNLRARLAEFRRSPLPPAPQLDVDLAFEAPGSQPLPPPAPNGRLVQDTTGRFIYTLRQTLPPNWRALDANEITDYLVSLDSRQFEDFWHWQVLLDGRFPPAIIAQLEEQLARERDNVSEEKLYTLDVLSLSRDFRVMLGLQYMVRLARECGVSSRFLPVLSMGFGSNVVSLSETARIYEAMITGFRHDAADPATLALAELDGRVDADGASIIDRIETPEGKVVYAREPHRVPVFDPATSAEIASILHNVVNYGTGASAKKQVRLRSDDPKQQALLDKMRRNYPLLGKTGTANDYRNAAFLGYVPVPLPDGSGVGFQGGYTVGVYVGYDDNQKMVRSGFRTTGSRGALPAWSGIAQAILDTEKIADRFDATDLAFGSLSLQYPELGQVFVPVAPSQGGLPERRVALRQSVSPDGPSTLCFGSFSAEGQFLPQRRFLPFWKNR
ncbi:MAG: transglycosylase domain-containing protein [Desulfobulbus sp.]|jgi:penicillin-binding protein 1A